MFDINPITEEIEKPLDVYSHISNNKRNLMEDMLMEVITEDSKNIHFLNLNEKMTNTLINIATKFVTAGPHYDLNKANYIINEIKKRATKEVLQSLDLKELKELLIANNSFLTQEQLSLE